MDGPRYREIARALETEIAAMPDGQRIPGENELATRFGVARSTARAALQDLTNRNLVRRVRGAGSFAVRRVDYPIDADRAPSWSATIRASGAVPSGVVLSCAPTVPPAPVAEMLALAEGARCHRLVRRSYVNGQPAAYGVEWVPTSVVPELAAALRATDSLYRLLREQAGATPRRAWVRASAEVCDAEVAAQLDVAESALAWYVESLTRDTAGGRPLCLTWRWIRSDTVRVVFSSTLGATPVDPS